MSRRQVPASASICTFVFPPYVFLIPHPSSDRFANPNPFPPPGEFSPQEQLGVEEVGSGWMILMKRFIYGFIYYTSQANLLGIENLQISSPPLPNQGIRVFVEFIILGNNDNTICVSTSYIRTGQTKLN